MIKSLPQKEKGFTLIEMIVSLGVFSVVITIAVGALLVIISTNRQLQAEQSVMSNLAFAMDSMTREMRTGYNYYCDLAGNDTGNNIFNDAKNPETILNEDTNDCPPGSDHYQGVSFFESGDSVTKTAVGAKRIMYYYVDNSTSEPNKGKIMRRVGNDAAQSIIPSNLVITDAQFYVTGSDPQSSPGTDTEQPTITIYLEAQEINNTDKTYRLQTTVTQRILDI